MEPTAQRVELGAERIAPRPWNLTKKFLTFPKLTFRIAPDQLPSPVTPVSSPGNRKVCGSYPVCPSSVGWVWREEGRTTVSLVSLAWRPGEAGLSWVSGTGFFFYSVSRKPVLVRLRVSRIRPAGAFAKWFLCRALTLDLSSVLTVAVLPSLRDEAAQATAQTAASGSAPPWAEPRLRSSKEVSLRAHSRVISLRDDWGQLSGSHMPRTFPFNPHTVSVPHLLTEYPGWEANGEGRGRQT